jgi:transposase
MTAEQRLLFADTLAEDEASLQAKLAELQRGLPETPKTPKAPPRQAASPGTARAPGTRRTPPRARGHHLPERRLRPADAAHRRGRQREAGHHPGEVLRAPAHLRQVGLPCCQQLRQEPAEPEVVDGGIPAAGLVAHTLISRFVDHLPYYRQAPINAARACTRRARRWRPGAAPGGVT